MCYDNYCHWLDAEMKQLGGVMDYVGKDYLECKIANSFYASKAQRGCYTTKEGMLVTWRDGTLLEYPFINPKIEGGSK